MKKSFIATTISAKQAVADAWRELQEELILNPDDLTLIPERKGGEVWYRATIQVPDTDDGLRFLADCVDNGHYNQASPTANAAASCFLRPLGGRAYEVAFNLPTLVVGRQSFGERYISEEIRNCCWVGTDDPEGEEMDDTFVHDIYILHPGLPVGAKAVFVSATSESEVTLEKVSEEAWEARLLLPSVQYVCAGYGAQDADTSPYGGTYFQVFKKAWISHREKIQREAKRECFSALEKSASAPLTWNLGELFRSLA